MVLAAGAIAVAVVVAARDDPAPEDRALRLEEDARRLYEVEPYDLASSVTLASWKRDGLVLRAEYEDGRFPAWFSLRLWPTYEDAKEWFEDAVESLATDRELGYMNGISGVEYCHRVEGARRCVGYDENRTFVAERTGAEDANSVRPLMRIAAKHWYRVMGGTSDTY